MGIPVPAEWFGKVACCAPGKGWRQSVEININLIN